jgi:preprotein translocase subunit Sec61beta
MAAEHRALDPISVVAVVMLVAIVLPVVAMMKGSGQRAGAPAR